MSTSTLGILTNTVSPSKWDLQDAAADLLASQNARVCFCCKRQSTPAVEVKRQAGQTFFSGLWRCGSVWTCPICASRISEGRRADLAAAVTGWQGSIFLVTLTLQHSQADNLADLLASLKDAWRRVKAGKGWLTFKDKWQLAAYVTGTEVTHGVNGWHPHMHVLVFSKLPADQVSIEAFEAELSARYRGILSQSGHYASEFYGLKASIGHIEAGKYVSKFGLEAEVTKGQTMKEGKDGKTPFQLLADYANGSQHAGLLFKEYVTCFEGKKQLTWSKNAREILGLTEEETPDADLAAEPEPEAEAELIAVLYPDQWAKVVKGRRRGQLLEVARSGSFALWEWLFTELGIELRRENIIT